MAAVAPAAAISRVPLTIRPAARGRLLVLDVPAKPVNPWCMAPALVRLFKLAVVAPVAPEALRMEPWTALPGLAPKPGLLDVLDRKSVV